MAPILASLRVQLALLVVLFWGQASTVAREQPGELGRQARELLKIYCYRCHGQDGAVEGGMSYILDRDRLVARGKVVPGKAADSPLYRRVATGKMPPPEESPRPNANDIALLKKWIDGGAPSPEALARPRALLTESDIQRHILADLDKTLARQRRFLRYFSLAPQHNAGLGSEELRTYRIALTHLLNSLSWHPRITTPRPIDPEGLILRIDLRHYLWDAATWDRLLADYPYGLSPDTAAARACTVYTLSRLPVIRADWFLATACRPPLYQDLLQLPTSAAELERQLRVDVVQDIQQERVARAGFNGSGVARNNRILERHDSMLGAYWRTYDFDAVPQNLADRDVLLPDRRNIFAYPLGPGAGDTTFQHAGGEIIFSLPNGLHGFMLVNANGVRVDKAPVAIVSDSRRPDRQVETGISCMSCHVHGINFKDDQIRAHIARNPKGFSKADADTIRSLYVPADKMRSLMEEDAERYRKAVEKCGGRIGRTAPIATLTMHYEADMDLTAAAAEIGLSPEEFRTRLSEAVNLSRNLGPLATPGGTVHRPVWVQAFADLARSLNLGTIQPAGSVGQRLPDNTGELDPLEAQSSPANSAAFSPDGSRALFASADKSVRLWNVEAGRDVRRFVGHTASVWAVSFSPDGQTALSAGADRIVRLWDTRSGTELRRMAGHDALVAAVAIAPDKRRALSSGYDHTVILWDLDSGREIRRFPDQGKYPPSVAFTPDGRKAIFGGESLRLISLDNGIEMQRFHGHSGAVTSAIVCSDGKQVLSCSEDGTARLWDIANGRLVQTFKPNSGPVHCAALSPGGKTALTGGADGAIRLWDVATGKERKLLGKHNAAVIAVAYSPDGAAGLSCSRDAAVRIFPISEMH